MKEIWKKFKEMAKKENCTVKMVGGYSFRSQKRYPNKGYKFCRLASAKGGLIEIKISYHQ